MTTYSALLDTTCHVTGNCEDSELGSELNCSSMFSPLLGVNPAEQCRLVLNVKSPNLGVYSDYSVSVHRSQSGKWFPLLPPEVLLSPRSATHFANRKRLLFIINETPVFIQHFFYFLTYTIVKNVYGGSEKKIISRYNHFY